MCSPTGARTPSGSTNPVAVTMNAPKSVTANYATQHKLTLATSPGAVALSNITGGTNGTFYDAGTVLSLQAATPVAIDAGSQYRFDSWSGDATGTSQPGLGHDERSPRRSPPTT